MKLINIYRDQYTVIPREVVFDKRLDYRSRGILTTLLALPDGWSFSVEGLAALVSSNNDGSKGLGSAALNYFRAKGAFVLETHSDENVKYYIKQGGKVVLQRKLTKNLKYSIIVSNKRIEREKKMKDKIKLAVIGLGGRGMGLMHTVLRMKDVEVVAVCDLYEDRVNKALAAISKRVGSARGEADYCKLLDKRNVDAMLVTTAWSAHSEIAFAAMEAGIPVGCEVGGAYSVEECFRLVEVSERTGTPYMMLENCCYGEYELACLNMVRQGLFGTVVNVEGGYKHDLRDEICYGEKNRHYRLKEYMSRNADNYPTHEIGPIAKLLDINRGNRFVSLRSLASKSAGLKEFVSRGDDEYLNKLRDVEFKQGDVVHTLIECANGETVHIVLDTCLPRPYSRGFTVQGTKGMYTEEGNYFYFDSKAAHLKSVIFGKSYNNGKRFVKKYAHPIWKKIRFASALGGHGGMDYLVLRAFIEAVAGGEPMPIDVYDAATWMAITALSAESIEKGGARVEFPDFTSGKWKERKPVAFCGYKI